MDIDDKYMDDFAVAVIIVHIQSTLFINNCVFMNNTLMSDIVVKSNVNVILYNSTFINNNNDHAGPVGIDENSSLNINNCQFINNTGRLVSAIEVSGGSTLQALNILFQNNTGFHNKGAVNVKGVKYALLERCIFSSNIGFSGGAISIQDKSNVTIRESRFISNEANGGPLKMETLFDILYPDLHTGGAVVVMNANATFIETSFISNSAKTYGGGLYALANATVFITNCLFRNNTSSRGGALYVYSRSRINAENSQFIDNVAVQASGSIFADSKVYIDLKNCTFQMNTGGLVDISMSFQNQAILKAVDCFFMLTSGNSIKASQSFLHVRNSKFTNQSNIYLEKSNLEAYSVDFFEIKMTQKTIILGLIQSTLLFVDCRFFDIYYDTPGTALQPAIIGTEQTTLTIKHCLAFQNDKIIFIYAKGNSTVDVEYMSFSNNNNCPFLIANFPLIVMLNKTFLINNTKYNHNIEMLAVNDGPFFFINGDMHGNIVKSDHGLINTLNSNVTILHSLFSENQGCQSGGILFFASHIDANLNIINSTFLDNHATAFGAALNIESRWSRQVDVVLDSCLFAMNTAFTDSAIFVSDVSSLHMSNITFVTKENESSICIMYHPEKIEYSKSLKQTFLTHSLTFIRGNSSLVSSPGKEFEKVLVSTETLFFTNNKLDHHSLDFDLLGHHQSSYASGLINKYIILIEPNLK